MFKAFEFCIPTRGTKVPSGPDWLHEIKYDGFRLRVERDDNRIRLLTRNGHDWSKRYPWIVESALKNRTKRFVIDGEAVVLGVDGVSNFNALHSRKHDHEVQLVRVRHLSARRGRSPTTALEPAENESRPPVGPSAGQIRCAIRARRDRA